MPEYVSQCTNEYVGISQDSACEEKLEHFIMRDEGASVYLWVDTTEGNTDIIDLARMNNQERLGGFARRIEVDDLDNP